MSQKPILYCATTNPGKLREFRGATESFVIEPLPELSKTTPPEETGVTFEENAILKANFYSAFTSELMFAEDSGLEVEALAGAPGVYSARFAGSHATDAANNKKLLDMLAGATDRLARYVCSIALARNSKVIATFRGTVEGEILTEERGRNGFGYDPMFYYPPFACTFGEASAEMKLTVSHRGEAVRQMVEFLRNMPELKQAF